MNIAIFGDSFANGETDQRDSMYLHTHGGMRLSHLGLTQYLSDDGHFVVNFSRQGNMNYGIMEDYRFHMRQNPHLKFDIAFVFETEITLCSLSQTSDGVRSSYSQDSKYSCVLRVRKV